MRDRRTIAAAGLLLAVSLLAGCHYGDKPLAYFGRTYFEHYKEAATEIDYPTVHSSSQDAALATDEPRRVGGRRKDEIWDMTLAEALHQAMSHSQLLRTNLQFLNPLNSLLTNPEIVPSVFDPAIQETEVTFGRRGVEAALSDFDAQFTTSMLWTRDEQVQNNLFSGGLTPGDTLVEEGADFNARLQKQMATGGLFSVSQNINYSANNVPGRLFRSAYTGSLRADYRHPLLAGSGTDFNRIAGPLAGGIDGFSVDQGVLIARINNDISIADFEAGVRNLLKDVEDLYWDLSLAYRAFDAERVARNSALRTWREVESKRAVGTVGGSAADEAQALDQYYESEARAQNALADVYETESRLRRLIGLPVNDGRVIRPVDEPVSAEFLPDWHICLAEALTRRVELRRQKWQIKSLELQLRAATGLTRPRLDFISGYHVNGFGDHLFGQSDDDGTTAQGFSSFAETLSQGDQTGWELGFEFSVPIGLREAHSRVRNIELRLAKARAALAAQELDVSHELSVAFQGLGRWYETAATNFDRRRAAELRVRAAEAEYEAGRSTLDLLLRAQLSLSQAEINYYRSLSEYNKAIADVHYRKGTLLERNNVFLAEDRWHPRAYADAVRRAWARSFAFPNREVHSEPYEFVVPAAKERINAAFPPGVTTPAAHDLMVTPIAPDDFELAPPPDVAPEVEPGFEEPTDSVDPGAAGGWQSGSPWVAGDEAAPPQSSQWQSRR